MNLYLLKDPNANSQGLNLMLTFQFHSLPSDLLVEEEFQISTEPDARLYPRLVAALDALLITEGLTLVDLSTEGFEVQGVVYDGEELHGFRGSLQLVRVLQ